MPDGYWSRDHRRRFLKRPGNREPVSSSPASSVDDQRLLLPATPSVLRRDVGDKDIAKVLAGFRQFAIRNPINGACYIIDKGDFIVFRRVNRRNIAGDDVILHLRQFLYAGAC